MSHSKQLGVVDGKLAPMPKSPNAVSTQSGDPGRKVEALAIRGSVAETKSKIIECLNRMGNNSVKTESDDYLHAVFVTPLMRFKDDVEFYIDESSGVVHFRSASRVGYSDLGANRKRYEAFRSLYQS